LEELWAPTNRYLIAGTLRLSLIALLAVGPAAPSAADSSELRVLREGSTVASGVAIKDLIVRQFSQQDPHYVRRRSAFENQVRDVAERIAQLESAGRALSCTTQIYHEVKWLVQYTAYWQRVERRLADLEKSFGVADQTFADDQSPDDGAWGACFEPIFLRISATADALELLRAQGAVPAFPITLEPSLRTSRQVVERVSSLIVSDIAGFGINHRAQLNSLITTITRGMFKPHWQDFLTTKVKMLPRHRNPAGPLELRQRMRSLLDAWQDPDTGFWGAWYKTDGALVRTRDLSITFHIVSYLRGEINHWPQALSTLRAMKDEPYPYGWLHEGGYVNHNNYDVARMLSYGWRHLSPPDQAFFEKELASMLAWTLTASLTDDGRFRSIPDFFESLSADYYYGVQFLDVIGFWDVKKRFWTATEFPKAAEVCTRIRRSIERDGLTDSTAVHVRERLDAICPG
jgi:hypothetical protein